MVTAVGGLQEHAEQTDRQIRELVTSIRELRETQQQTEQNLKQTEQNLNALIKIVDDLIRRNGQRP